MTSAVRPNHPDAVAEEQYSSAILLNRVPSGTRSFLGKGITRAVVISARKRP